MPDKPTEFIALRRQDQNEILQEGAARLGRQAVVLEKDVWVCWTLQALFSIPDPHPMAFKGGTSLSKVFGVIDRFSEDVDLTFDIRALIPDLLEGREDATRSQQTGESGEHPLLIEPVEARARHGQRVGGIERRRLDLLRYRFRFPRPAVDRFIGRWSG